MYMCVRFLLRLDLENKVLKPYLLLFNLSRVLNTHDYNLIALNSKC